MIIRPIELLKAAAAAEALRLRVIFGRQRLRAIYAAVAVVFALATLVLLHVVIYHTAALWLTVIQSDLVVLAFDLVIAGALTFLAMKDNPDAIQVQALEIRQRAVAELTQIRTLASGAAGLLLPRQIRSVARSRSGLLGSLAGAATKRLISKS
jgi:hypothetical protein